jgi:hypothetical protein
MEYRIEIEPGLDNYGMYYDERDDRKIKFDFHITKNEVQLFPESFSNWLNDTQEKLTVFEYIKVIKRIMNFFRQQYPKHHIIF